MKSGVIFGLLIAAGLAGAAWWWFGSNSDDEIGIAVSRYATVETLPIASTVLATGIIRLRVGAEVRVGSMGCSVR